MYENKNGYRVEILNLNKSFDGLNVFRDLNVTIEAGDFVAIVAQNGIGKSTLLRMISGLDSFDSGSIKIDGSEITGIQREVKLLFREANLLPWRNIIKNVTLGTEDNNEAAAAQMLEKGGLINKKFAWPGALTEGEKQIVSLTRALAGRPKVLLLDDPLGTLDVLTKMDIQDLIEKLWLELRFTAVLVTGDVNEAVRLANRVIVLEDKCAAADLQITLPRPRLRDMDSGYFEQYIMNRYLLARKKQPEENREEYII